MSHANGHRPLSRDHAQTELLGRGAVVRERLVRDAAEVIAERGAGTTLDDVSAMTGRTKRELEQYFGDHRGLVKAVVEHECANVVGWHTRVLAAVSSWEDLERWAEVIVSEQSVRSGCPVGTLAAVLSDTDETLRTRLSEAFRAWSRAIWTALVRLRDNGLIAPSADLDALATMTLSAIQGGLLLAKLSRDPNQLRTALAGALIELRTHASGGRRRRR